MINYYSDLKKDVNNMSYWLPKVKDCGINIPETIIKEIPIELFPHLFMDHPEKDIDAVYGWVTCLAH